MGDDVRLSVRIAAPPAAVWACLADPERRATWWSYLELDPRPGGALEERWRDAEGTEQVTRGEVLEAVPGERLRCTWRDDGWVAATEVTVTLAPADGGATDLELRHGGWDRLGDAGPPLRDVHREGWAMHLANLQAAAESR